jgi:hypothetical protein
MQELLERLKKVDPETYREWYASEGVYPEEGYELSDVELDVLQGTIQRAIEAKGWGISIGLDIKMDDSKGWSAYIGKPVPFGAKWAENSYGDSPTAAILSAYLAALEAQ